MLQNRIALDLYMIVWCDSLFYNTDLFWSSASSHLSIVIKLTNRPSRQSKKVLFKMCDKNANYKMEYHWILQCGVLSSVIAKRHAGSVVSIAIKLTSIRQYKIQYYWRAANVTGKVSPVSTRTVYLQRLPRVTDMHNIMP